MTKPGANSGMYIHTEFQEEGWPAKGYEIQVNNSHTDWRRTGSVYGIQDVKEPPAKDDKWFTQHIIVQGNKITVKVDGKIINEYTVPAEGGKLSRGTFALQGHDPKSMVLYKDVMVKVLPDVVGAAAAPLSAVDRMTVISADGAGALGRSVAANVAQGLQLSGDLTGIDVAALLRRLSGATGADGVTRVPIGPDGDGADKV